ncbi:MAG: hypothetical protein ACI97A_000800 [Planctomycetota bacterium]|jgi:hypothetical protein
MKTRSLALLVLFGLALLMGCTSTPDAEELPEDETLVKTQPKVETPPPETVRTPQIPVTRLKIKGVRGGKISFDVQGIPSEIAAQLLDFDQDADHRSWVKKFEPLPKKGKMSRARWHFEGKAGINPVVELGFWLQGDEERQVIRYRLVKKDFGLGAFFGDLVITRKADSPLMSTITERTFIDSGVWIANASHEDIEEGLREDARLLAALFAGTLEALLAEDQPKEN